ncbi:hypothetical protein [Bremerella sp. P1]|uniref:hypothetical protein n=1 Tax=Bremerella sp. P1 TaxID=3026424 RepID=UPI0023685741|nr:hypothetical protein [Bremerella sp. P1]WDI44762.1 hypothetical protein PSR63_12530 [Bremerella sp. P1]
MAEILANPYVQLALIGGLVYLLLFSKDDDKDGNREITIPGLDKDVEIDKRVIQDLVSRMSASGLGQIADLLATLLSGNAAEIQAQAKVMSKQLDNSAGKYAMLGDGVRAYMSEMSKADPDEFRSLKAHMANLSKDVKDNADRVLKDETLIA